RRRRHEAKQRGRGNDGGTRQVPFATEPHAVLPIAIEGGNRALSGGQRVRTLAETRAAPRLPDRASDRTEHLGDRLTLETGVCHFDLTADAAGSGEDGQLARDAPGALRPGRLPHQRRPEQVVLAPVRG